MQTTDKIVDGIAYERDYLSRGCDNCVADGYKPTSNGTSLCTLINDRNCSDCYSFKVKDITKKHEAWVTIEGDNGAVLECTEEFREKLINHPKVIAAYEKSIVKEVKHSTSEQKGVKTDTGKPRYGLIPPFALEQVAICLTEGLKTHPAKDNWKLVENAKERFLESLERHFQQYKMGEVFDRDNPNVRNLAAVIVNALFALEFEVNPELKGKEC